ncbi:MAM and LDL-receptor class A domain-containing protein 1 [Astyanax mexicanus]|uniref:MAM and LDL-receptor class A domain-containing protein 1 n=1 Tax=Astyanax mexicanus TaxID=7994 RepID=UPI0020CB0F8F|nr:MAM and LDL-receptor class A domain-containing protein 1 [Astyanax mexicanus]
MTAWIRASLLAYAVACVSGQTCLPGQFECRRGECVSEESVCDFSEDCEDSSDEKHCEFYTRCNFEDGLCGLQTTRSDQIWTRGTCLTDPGPALDHKGNATGHYLYLHSDNGEAATAEISSPFFLPSESCRITFYHHIGLLDGALQLLTEDLLSGEDLQIWTETKPNADPLKTPWIRSSVTFRHSQEFRVVIRGLIFHSTDPGEVIAFDDLSFSQGCVLNAVGADLFPVRSSSQFDCSAGVCVDAERVCDFTPDCPQGEDEASCAAECDFETDSCGWHEFAPGDGFDWVRSSPVDVPTQYQYQAPPRDHSTNSSSGHFMFVLKNSNSFSQRALLHSPTFQQSGSNCTITFWHFNAGLSVGAANMYLRVKDMDTLTVLWRTLYHQGNQWLPVTVQIGRQTRPFYISVSKLSLGVYDGVSALDDITFQNCSLPKPMDECPTPDHFHCRRSRACVERLQLCDLVDDCGDGSDEENCSSELMCDFEEGLCSWTQDVEGDIFDWSRIQGPTPTPKTGPLKDHTWGTVDGHYLYIESSSPQEFKDTAVLISRAFKPTASESRDPVSPCVFRFHYHMLGEHIFRLAVYIRNRSGGRGQMLWVRYGEQGDLWHRKTLYLNSVRPFQILVEGTVGDDFTGDIAIDDLSFLGCEPYEGSLPSAESITPTPPPPSSSVPPHSCPLGQFACGSYGECVSQGQVCDFRLDCSDGSDEKDCVKEHCDFEDGDFCGWNLASPAPPVPIHAFRWQAGQGETIHHGEEFHRPYHDHTLGTLEGWYVYADSSNGGYGQTSALLTPPITATGPQCTMGFWYYMSGFTVGTLQVFIKSANATHEVWSETGNQGSRWMRGEVFIGIRHNFQVILRAKRGVSYMGDVVVDDVAFIDCSPPVFSDRSCRKDEFACANGHCIPQGNLCDFIDHCGDSSDENHYICKGFHGQCNFEFDICSWKQHKSDSVDWLIKTGRTPTLGTGPSTDHTLRNSLGHYLYLDSSFPQVSGDVARLSGLWFSHRSQDCKMMFYLHMSGDGCGTLSVYLTTKLSQALQLNISGHQGNYWIRHEVPLSSAEHFQVMFEGTVGRNSKGDICLDDITFSPGCLLKNNPLADFPPSPPTGSCPLGMLPCDNGSCYKPEQSCDFKDNCGDNSDEKDCGTSCSFEDGRCGWKSSPIDKFNWVLGTGSAQSIKPPHDHTLMNENGHFMYMAATPVGLKGDKAHLRSSVWRESSATCKLAFWYYISHKATGLIRLFLKTENELREVWMEQRRMFEWKRAEVPLRNLRNFELIFEAVRVIDVSGGAALDDLEFIDCARSVIHPGACPAATDFRCSNCDCIDSSLVCDNKADCADRSDELDCTGLAGACNFNMPEEQWELECRLQQDQNDDFDWQIGHGQVHQGTGPSSDHSLDGSGGYLYVNSALQREGDVARVTTQLEFPASVGVCHLRLWFYMFGSKRMGTLKVYTVGRNGVPLLMWAASGNHGRSWRYSNVVLSNPLPFRVTFEAVVGGDKWTDIAIDDLSFTPGCSIGAPVTSTPPTCDPESFQCVYLLECVPLSWRCDGEADCVDRSDEEGCESVTPGTVPPQTVCKDTQFRCSNGTCVPALLRCDSVPDCPDEEDEYGCPSIQCDNGELVCESTGGCVPCSRRCDHTSDCPPFNPDESSCDVCPFGYCLNRGICFVGNHGPVCICKSGWTGNRCHVEQKPATPTSSDVIPDTELVTVYTGVSIAVVLLAIAGGVTMLFFFQRKHSARDSSLIANMETDSSVCNQKEKFPDVRAKTRAKYYWSTFRTFPKPSISVYPWRDELEYAAKLFFSNPLYEETRSCEA